MSSGLAKTAARLLTTCVYFLLANNVSTEDIDRKHVKCLVCRRVVEEMLNELNVASPTLKYAKIKLTLNSRPKEDLKPSEKKVSELFLVEVMERLCKKMGEYVRVKDKVTGELNVIPILVDGKMNTDLGTFEIIKDGDLESLEFYCESILSEYDEDVVRLFKSDIGAKKCTKELCYNTGVCKKNTGNTSLSKDEL